jgi:hypothetical protein
MIERHISPFNGPIEIGLRSLIMLTKVYPLDFSIQQLVAFDYLLVHSDDLPDGPTGLHPKIPQRSGEYLIRRKTLQEGLLLYMSRGLISQEYRQNGLRYIATELSGNFLDSLTSDYTKELQDIADWVADNFSTIPESELNQFMKEHLDKWGTEFITEPVLWPEDSQ